MGFLFGAEIPFPFAGVNFDLAVVGTLGQEVVTAKGFFRDVALDHTGRVGGLTVFKPPEDRPPGYAPARRFLGQWCHHQPRVRPGAH